METLIYTIHDNVFQQNLQRQQLVNDIPFKNDIKLIKRQQIR